MNCPNCQSKFKKVILKSHYGVNIELEQCPDCGGIWCDNLEMYRVSPNEALKVDKLDIKKLEEFTLIKKKLICPKCKASLKEFKDTFFPKQIKLEYCPKCRGLWLNRGELSQFKKWQKEKIKISPKEKLEKNKELAHQLEKIVILEKLKKGESYGGREKTEKALKKAVPPSTFLMGLGPSELVKNKEYAKIIAYFYVIIQILFLIAKRVIVR